MFRVRIWVDELAVRIIGKKGNSESALSSHRLFGALFFS
jgi:hypothetical protein